MNILITAGGTTEKIDDVRAITNTGTGKLASLVADRFAMQDDSNQIIYVCSKGAVRPSVPAEIRIADDTAALEQTMRELCTTRKIDIVIHSMAVSDYRTKTVTTSDLLAKSIAAEAKGNAGERANAGANADANIDVGVRNGFPQYADTVADLIRNAPNIGEAGKIRSNHDDLVIVLEKTPKIIAMLRGLLPEAVIVGFKLLANVPERELIDTGLSMLQANDCDFVLANDMQTVAAGKHTGYLIERGGAYTAAEGKDRIAELIAKTILDHCVTKKGNAQ